MELQIAFGQVLRRQRKAKGLSQEAFTSVSSRTYLSELERGLKNPTLDKIDELATTMGIHPLTLLTECYLIKDGSDIEEVFARVIKEFSDLGDS
ncbi:helix-turn-helix domain-containing protein [Marinobacter xestospongiae]|uniref:Helix-turn-helix transcriptional regulator n=1 Tax=Marinobacter xestospongiae TaxID=994319 RepID=A0ABU3W1G8_9GAMM|nr:helix-turn-helix transcriptional regulator [Marinobacter xestospongiae]MDV2080380.1 helix-turn-helix transcriptional regulator [Marinobacter xestospongiae]